MVTYGLITHNDLDAAACALITKFYYPHIGMSFNTYDSIDNSIKSFINKGIRNIIIADICPSEDMCELLDSKLSEGELDTLILADHHITKRWVSKFNWAFFDESKCGAEILYSALLSLEHKELDASALEFLDSVSAWDLWKTTDKNRQRGENLNTLVKFLGKTAFIHEFSKFIDEFASFNRDKEGDYTALLTYINNQKHRYIDHIKYSQIKNLQPKVDGFGRQYGVIIATDFISEIGHLALEEHGDLKYVIVVNPISGTCSIRSIPSIDVSLIAKSFGGGGHKNAAGFRKNFTEAIRRKIYNMCSRLEP